MLSFNIIVILKRFYLNITMIKNDNLHISIYKRMPLTLDKWVWSQKHVSEVNLNGA